MKKIILLILVALGTSVPTWGQQDALFTNYIFNPLPINPAYTGSTEALDMVLINRHQWVGFDGAFISTLVYQVVWAIGLPTSMSWTWTMPAIHLFKI